LRHLGAAPEQECREAERQRVKQSRIAAESSHSELLIELSVAEQSGRCIRKA
jgi:hypothetical protein